MADTYKLLADRYERLPGRRIKGIDESTQNQVVDMVNEGLRRGYSALQIANGVDTEDYQGVASIFDDPYRSERISRTEGLFAFNWGAGNSFLDSGITAGEAMDGSDDPECAERDGKVYTLDVETGYFVDDSGEPVEDHPNGTLAWAPVIEPGASLLPTGALAAASADEADAESQARARQALADDAGVDPDDPSGVLNYLTDAEFTTGVLDEIEGASQDYGVGETNLSLESRRDVDWETKYSPDQPRDEQGRFGDTGGGDVAGAVVAGAAQGGFTVQPYRGTSPKTGYQVAITGHTEEFPKEILQDPVKLAAAIASHLENNKSVYSKGGKLYIGGWVNTDSAKLVLEPSERISSRTEAISAGQNRNQISIWDNAKGEEIQTGGTGTG